MFETVRRLGGDYIWSTTRIKKDGRTEWVYCSQDVIVDAFNEAKNKYGGTLFLWNTANINKDAVEIRRNHPSYTGEVIFPLAKKL